MADELKAKVLAYDFDGLGQAGFARLLAEEERIAVPLAEKITGEYLRFVYLTQVSDTPLTPSIQVDMAWHLHLTRTRDYWEGLCKGVLGKELHHDADKSKGAAEKHNAQYKAARVLYGEVFGEAPPAHIWPTAPVAGKTSGLTVAFGVIGGLLLLVGVSLEHPLKDGLWFILSGVVLVALAAVMDKPRQRRNDRGGSGCSAAACTGGGSRGDSKASGGWFDGGDSDGGGAGADCGGGGD